MTNIPPWQILNWDQLDYWQSGEWQVVQERLDDMDKRAELYNPRREFLFSALDATPYEKVKVAIIGQDPYPDRNCACGLAFSIPNGTIPTGMVLPPTLDNLFREYVHDLHYPYPTRTNLDDWATRGVLLWNAIPSCQWKQSMSHDWPEWELLTKEIIQRLSDRCDIVFVFMGGIARRFVRYVDTTHNTVLETSHPIPRASRNTTRRNILPFTGSRIFTRINDALVRTHRKDAINWKIT